MIAIVESVTLINSTQVQRCDTNCDSTPGFRPFFCRKFAVFTVVYYEGSGFVLNKIFSIQAWPTRFYALDEPKIADLLLTGVLSC